MVCFLSFQLDDWVLCRIYKKKQIGKALEEKVELSSPQIDITAPSNANEDHSLKFPRTCSISHLLELEYLGPISQLLNDNSYNSTFEFQNNLISSGTDPVQKLHFGEMPYQNTDSGKFQVTQSSFLNQPMFMNPVYNDVQGLHR